MATRTGSAVWEGTLKSGKGKMKLGSGAFEGSYSFTLRSENAGGTNPEEDLPDIGRAVGSADQSKRETRLKLNSEFAELGSRSLQVLRA